MRRCVQVAQSLREREPRCKERILDAKNLSHAARPPNTLPDVGCKTLCGQPRCKRNIDVRRVPAVALQTQSRVGVFGNRFYGDTTDLLQCCSSHDSARSAEETCIPKIVAVLHQPMEQLSFVRNPAKLSQVSFEWIGRVEVVR